MSFNAWLSAWNHSFAFNTYPPQKKDPAIVWPILKSSKCTKVCAEILTKWLLCLESEGVLAAYLRPLKPAAHWHCPEMWLHSPPLRHWQSLLQLMPYLPRGHGWAQTKPCGTEVHESEVLTCNTHDKYSYTLTQLRFSYWCWLSGTNFLFMSYRFLPGAALLRSLLTFLTL